MKAYGESLGITEYSYTKKELVILSEFLTENDDRISDALKAFVQYWDCMNDISMSVNEVLHLWLPMIEKIKDNPKFIEEHFRPNYLNLKCS